MKNRLLRIIGCSITKKSMLVLGTIGMLIITLINAILPSAFYILLKPHFINNMTSVTNGVTKELGFLFNLAADQHRRWINHSKINQLILEYYKEDNKEDTKKEIISSLPDQGHNRAEPGAVTLSHDVMIAAGNDTLFYQESYKEQAQAVIQSAWYHSFLANTHKQEYSSVFHSYRNGAEYSFFAYAMKFEAEGIPCVSILLIDFKCIQSALAPLLEYKIDDYLILGHENALLYSNLPLKDSSIDITKYPGYMLGGNQYEIFQWGNTIDNGVDFIVRATYMTENIRFVFHFSKDNLLLPFQPVLYISQVLVLIFFMGFLIFICLVLKGSLKNLNTLAHKMLKVKDGDYHVEMDVKSSDEIGILSDTFNIMIKKINSNIEEMAEYEKKQREMQYILLMSELDPHFIYNTLNNISYLAELGRVKDIVKLNDALIATLKDRLKLKNYQSFDTVRNEKTVLENYMLIQDYLTFNQIMLTFLVSENDLDLQIPKNILQPLVENSIRHGILRHKNEQGELLDGEICISVKKDADTIVLSVSDNGVGMDEDVIQKYFYADDHLSMDQVQHIGIKNIRMRLFYLYKDYYSISASSIKNKKTTIEIRIPDSAYQE